MLIVERPSLQPFPIPISEPGGLNPSKEFHLPSLQPFPIPISEPIPCFTPYFTPIPIVATFPNPYQRTAKSLLLLLTMFEPSLQPFPIPISELYIYNYQTSYTPSLQPFPIPISELMIKYCLLALVFHRCNLSQSLLANIIMRVVFSNL